MKNSLRLTWVDFKAFFTNRSVPIHETDYLSGVRLEAWDGPLHRECILKTGTADYTDYTTNYQAGANTSYTDSNGIDLSRTKVTQSGWYYQEHAIEITTANDQTFTNDDKAGTDLGFVAYTMYDSGDAVTTTNANAVKTVITWTPTHDFEIIGSQFYQSVAPGSDVRMFVTAVPDYPAPSGSIPFVQGGINLRHMGVGNILTVNGRSAKKMLYNNPVPGTNKFEMVFKHPAGVQHTVQIVVEMFKP